MLTDPIADLLTRIRNASSKHKQMLDVPASRIKEGILKRLKDEGFISNHRRIPDRKQGILRIWLKYSSDDKPVIKGLKRVSKPSLRVYKGWDEIPRVLRGLGVTLVSTPRGILTDKECRQMKVGGELLLSIW